MTHMESKLLFIPNVIKKDITKIHKPNAKKSLIKLNKEGWGRFASIDKKVIIYGKKGEYPIIYKQNNKNEYKLITNSTKISDFHFWCNTAPYSINQYEITNITNNNQFIYGIEIVGSNQTFAGNIIKNILIQCIVPIEQSEKMQLNDLTIYLTNKWLKNEIPIEKDKLSLPEFFNIRGKEIKYLNLIANYDFEEILNNKIISSEFSGIDKFLAMYYYLRYSLPIETIVNAKITIHSLGKQFVKQHRYKFDDQSYIPTYGDYMVMGEKNKEIIKETNYPFSLRIKPSKIGDEHRKLYEFLNHHKITTYNNQYNLILKKFKNENKNKFEYQEKDYLIILPKDADDIVNEGTILSHCVGRAGYIEKMVLRKTVIVFLRKSNNPDKPYFTIEINNGNIRQCFGYHDSFNKNKNVKEFITRYADNKGFRITANIG